MSKIMATIAIVAATAAMPAFGASNGKAVYDQACAMCHNNMPPKLGDKAAWAPLLKAGTDALVAAAIKGKGAMPPKGGHSALTDAEIRAAVEYIVNRSK